MPKKHAPPLRKKTIAYVGADRVAAIYADNFLFTTDQVFSIYFYQNLLPHTMEVGSGRGQVTPNQSQCIARMVMPSELSDKFLKTLAKHKGFTLQPIEEPEEESKE